MPNQLSKSKRRQSLAEHEAVLAALGVIARLEKTTVMALLREATRDLIRRKVSSPAYSDRLRRAVYRHGPRMPKRFKTAGQVVRFKRAQREYDQVLLDLGMATSQSIQEQNSVVPRSSEICITADDQSDTRPGIPTVATRSGKLRKSATRKPSVAHTKNLN